MPANSKAFRRAAAIAEHHPQELYKRNRSLLRMNHQQLHDFASTSEFGLPARKSKKQKPDDSERDRSASGLTA